MRNTIATAYTAVPIGVTVCIGHDRRNQRSRSRNPPGHLRRTIGHVPGITGHVGPEYSFDDGLNMTVVITGAEVAPSGLGVYRAKPLKHGFLMLSNI